MVDACRIATALLLLMAVATRFSWPGPTRGELRPTEVALLRGGRRAAVVQPAGPRELLARRPVRDALARLSADLASARLTVPAWRRVLLTGLAAAAGAVAAAGWVASGQASVGVPLAAVAVAILGLALFRRTLSGRRTVHSLRRRYAELPSGQELDAADWTPRSLGLAVALHGTPALRLTFPRFAARGFTEAA
jgi:hypothetical protein